MWTDTTGAGPGKGKKGKGNRNPWSDSEDEDGSFELSDGSDGEMGITVAARDRGPRRAAGLCCFADFAIKFVYMCFIYTYDSHVPDHYESIVVPNLAIILFSMFFLLFVFVFVLFLSFVNFWLLSSLGR